MKNTRRALAMALLALLLLALMAASLRVGSVAVRAMPEETAARIVDLRLRRMLASTLLGGALSVSGFLLQTFFANPIAGPFVLGVSSGAKLTVALAMVFLLSRGVALGSAGLYAAAFLGSMLVMGVVLLVSRRVRQMPLLVVCGVMVGYICSAVTDLVVTFADDANIVNLHAWSLGSFSGVSWDNVRVIAVIVGVALAWTVTPPLNAALPSLPVYVWATVQGPYSNLAPVISKGPIGLCATEVGSRW